MSTDTNDHVHFVDITQRQWITYRAIHLSGQFNMNDLSAIEMESEFELTPEIQKAIHKHYAALAGKYGK